jgi:hypothetical protein
VPLGQSFILLGNLLGPGKHEGFAYFIAVVFCLAAFGCGVIGRCTVVKMFDCKLRMMWYDGAIMMAKTQITLETEMQRRARQRANDLGVSLAEYFRRLLARDLARPEAAAALGAHPSTPTTPSITSNY